jgi:hypothetical protein
MTEIGTSCRLLLPILIGRRLNGLAQVFVAAFRVDFKHELLVGALRLASVIFCPDIAEVPAIRNRRLGELGPRLQEELSTDLPRAPLPVLLTEYVFPLGSAFGFQSPECAPVEGLISCGCPSWHPDDVNPHLGGLLLDLLSCVDCVLVHDQADWFPWESAAQPAEVLLHERDRAPTTRRVSDLVFVLFVVTELLVTSSGLSLGHQD